MQTRRRFSRERKDVENLQENVTLSEESTLMNKVEFLRKKKIFFLLRPELERCVNLNLAPRDCHLFGHF